MDDYSVPIERRVDAAAALELARRLDDRGEGLRVLRVEPGDLDPDQARRVDVGRLQSVPDRAADARSG